MDKKSNDALRIIKDKKLEEDTNKKFKYPYVRNQENRVSEILKKREKQKEKEDDTKRPRDRNGSRQRPDKK